MQRKKAVLLKRKLSTMMFGMVLATSSYGIGVEVERRPAQTTLERVQQNRGNPAALADLLPILRGSCVPNKYERILLTQLRDQQTTTKDFRRVADALTEVLAHKVVDCVDTSSVTIQTPVSATMGEVFAKTIEVVSVMRSGDALLDVMLKHFPYASVSKFLIQRDEETAEPHFKYMKLSASIASGSDVLITEPMIATGGTLDMVIPLLKEKGVLEENIIVACVCAAPEGVLKLCEKFPKIRVVMNVLDDCLNEKKYIVPGLGDFGDRYFGILE